MPELPEVEIIVRDLDKKLKNRKIKEIKVLDAKVLNSPVAKFREQIIGRIVKSVSRRAKMIIIELQDCCSDKARPYQNRWLIIHLKMTGQLVFKSRKDIIAGGHPITGVGKRLPNKFTRVIFEFNSECGLGDGKLYFNDVRRFGWIKLVDDNELKDIVSDLGFEPLTKKFSLKKFKEILAHKQKTTIKQAIMDQKYLAGLGNIYADESLFAAGIKPMRKVKTLKQDEIKKLWRVIPKILKYAIKHRGTSFNDYVDAQGERGNFVKYLKVYGRAGGKCKKCGTIIKKTKLAGRGTHWCNMCQK